MKFYEFEHDIFPHILIPLLGGLFVIAALQSAARAETPPRLATTAIIISSDDGYGVKDCIRGGDDCAKIVADAWCEAHGHGAAQGLSAAPATSRPPSTKSAVSAAAARKSSAKTTSSSPAENNSRTRRLIR